MFDKFRYKGAFQLVFDGTGLSNHDYNLNNNCLIRKHKDRKVSYYKYVLECKSVVGNIIISLDSDFIENKKMLTEKKKQDCETKSLKLKIKEVSIQLLKALTSINSDLNNTKTNFQLRFND